MEKIIGDRVRPEIIEGKSCSRCTTTFKVGDYTYQLHEDKDMNGNVTRKVTYGMEGQVVYDTEIARLQDAIDIIKMKEMTNASD